MGIFELTDLKPKLKNHKLKMADQNAKICDSDETWYTGAFELAD